MQDKTELTADHIIYQRLLTITVCSMGSGCWVTHAATPCSSRQGLVSDHAGQAGAAALAQTTTVGGHLNTPAARQTASQCTRTALGMLSGLLLGKPPVTVAAVAVIVFCCCFSVNLYRPQCHCLSLLPSLQSPPLLLLLLLLHHTPIPHQYTPTDFARGRWSLCPRLV